eukprot:6186935-Prymnesium_polylepis.1
MKVHFRCESSVFDDGGVGRAATASDEKLGGGVTFLLAHNRGLWPMAYGLWPMVRQKAVLERYAAL